MARRYKTIRLKNFTGGEASVFPITDMPAKHSVKLQNCHISEHGSVEKIPGYAKVNSTQVGATLTSGFEFKKTDGTAILLAAGGGNIYKVGSGDELTVIKSGLDTTATLSFASINDICIMVNGVDSPMKYDGTTVSNLGGTPPSTAFRVHVHKGRVWLLDRTDRMLATHSALNNPEDYTAANNAGYIDFKFILKKGDELLDVVTYIDLLVFFFRNHVAIYSGTNPTSSGDFRLVQLIEGAGVVTSGVVQALGTDLAFLYDSGVKSLKQVVTTGNLNIGDISELIDPTLRSEMKNSTVFSAAHNPGRGWLMLLINDKVWLYSYSWKAWGRMAGADVKGMFTTNDGKVYLCGTGFLYEYGSGWTFAGTYPSMIWETAWVTLSRTGERVFPKILEAVTHPEAQTTIDLQTRYDLNISMAENYTAINTQPDTMNYIDSIANWDNLNPVDEILYKQSRVPLFGGGRLMQMVFSNTSNQPVDISDIVLQAIPGAL